MACYRATLPEVFRYAATLCGCDLVSYRYSFVGGTDIFNSIALDYTASLGDIRTTGSLELPAQADEAFRLIAGYFGNAPTQTG